MKKIKVIVVDYSPVYGEGLGRLLSSESGIKVTNILSGRLETKEVAIQRIKQSNADIVVLYRGVEQREIIELVQFIKEIPRATKVLVLSSYEDDQSILDAIKVGADGYLKTSASSAELKNAIYSVYGGEDAFNHKTVVSILRNISSSQRWRNKGSSLLSPRELEVLKLVAKGKHNRDIAKSLFISERTVQSHISNILSKIGVGSRMDAHLYALRNGLLDKDDLS